MKKKRIIILMFVSCILAFLCGMGIGKNLQHVTVNVKESKEPFLVEPGEKLPINKLDLIKEENNDKKEKYKVMLFIDPYCESCLDKIVIAERMYNIFKDENIGIKIIWKNRPQDSFINKIDIPKDNQYITKEIDLLNEYPLYLLVDQNDKIIMLSDEEDKIIQKLFSFEDVNQEKVIQSSNYYLTKFIEKQDKSKKTLIYFAMEGCQDCEKAMKLLRENNIEDKYNMVTIYTRESYGEKEMVDIGGIFMNLYQIEWYPSFLIIDNNDYKFIGQMSSRELLECLNKEL